MTDSQMTGASAGAPATKRKRTAPRKSSARRKTVSRRRTSSARGREKIETLLKAWAKRTAGAGVTLATLSGRGVERARGALGKAGTASKKTIDRLTKEWKKMDTTRRVRFVAALLTALAAASAPLVRSRMKKK